MRKVTVSVQVDAEKLRAIQFYAGRKDSTVESELESCVEKLYDNSGPAPTGEYIESIAAPARPPRSGRPVPRPVEAQHEQ